MAKYFILAVGIIVLGVGVYYGRFLFIKRVVNEEIPESMKGSFRTVREGEFQKIDFIHKASGKAMVLEGTDGKRIVRFDQFEVTNGPDLYVYLVKNPTPTDKASLGKFLNLGKLKGTTGSQNYEIPPGADGYDTIVIWCQQFGVLFSYAAMQ